MKRTFSVIGFSYMLGLVLMNYVFEDSCTVFICAVSVLFAVSLPVWAVSKRPEISVALLSVLLSAAMFSLENTEAYAPAVEYADTKCEITAEVLDFPSRSSGGNYSYLIRTREINGKDERLKMYLYAPFDICAEPYDEVSFSSVPFIIGENDVSFYRYFRSKGTYIGAYAQYNINVDKPVRKPFLSLFKTFRGNSVDILNQSLSVNKAAFASAILFGDRVMLDSETLEDFTKSGAAHILAFSGLHMSVWVMGLYELLRKFRTKDKTASLICIGVCFAIVCLTSMSASVLRSAVMTCIYLSGALFGRRSDPLNSLGVAVFALCIINPFTVCDLSFLMTVFATLGVLLSARLTDRISVPSKTKGIEKALTYTATSVIISLGASLFVWPLTVNSFGTVSTLGWLVNLFIVPFLAPCMFLCGILIAYPGISLIAYPVKHILEVIIGYILGCVRLIATIPFSFIETDSFIFCRLLPIFIALVIFLIYNIRNKRFSVASLCCLGSISVVTMLI